MNLLKKMQNHSWYVGQELGWTPLFSDLINTKTKKKIVDKLKTMVDNWEERCIKVGGGAELVSKRTNFIDISKLHLEDIVGSASISVMKYLGIDIEFLLSVDVNQWETLVEYQTAVEIVKHIPCTNDAAERGCKLAKDYNTYGSKNEQIKQQIFKSVDFNRKQLKTNTKTEVISYFNNNSKK